MNDVHDMLPPWQARRLRGSTRNPLGHLKSGVASGGRKAAMTFSVWYSSSREP